MLEAMTPEEFDERWQADSLDPIDESWLQVGVVAAAVVNEIRSIAAGLSGRQLRADELNKPDDYIPKIAFEPPKQANGKTSAEIEQRWKALSRGCSR